MGYEVRGTCYGLRVTGYKVRSNLNLAAFDDGEPESVRANPNEYEKEDRYFEIYPKTPIFFPHSTRVSHIVSTIDFRPGDQTMKSTLFIISCFAFLCTGCFDDKHFYEIDITEEVDTMMMYGPDTAEIKLDFFVGQKIRYAMILFNGYYLNTWFEFENSPDTLELEVLDQLGDTFLIKESFTPFSYLILNPQKDYYAKQEDSIYLNYWFIRNDSLVIVKAPGTAHIHAFSVGSHLLEIDRLHMRDFRIGETKIVGYKTRVQYSEKDKKAFTRNYMLHGHHYDRLNIYINDRPMSHDGPGNSTVYSQVYGIVRSSYVEYWSFYGFGWDRL